MGAIKNLFHGIELVFAIAFLLGSIYYVKHSTNLLDVKETGYVLKILESRNNLQKLCPINSKVSFFVKDTDKYKREVAVVKCNNDNINANKSQVANGYAWAYKEYSYAYIIDQINAKTKQLGLWKDSNPQKPSDFRLKKKEQN